MSAKHTPGPWRLGPKHPGSGVRTINAAGVGIGTFSPFIGHGVRQLATDEANARLIAAAPDLLAALRALVDAADFEPDGMLRLHDRGLNWESEKLTKARAAIAKATGE